jgi:hypothetical protein
MVFKEKYIMAIYPYTNTYVINKDAVAGSQFKAGMVLMMNSDGKAVPADSQSLAFDSVGQKQAKILGLAAGDSNLTGNTIIVQDTVGNNYLDSSQNFVNASNAEYVAIKRQLLDYADETINEYYNMNFSPIQKRRGVGVYSLTGDTFATDQFIAVLHGDYGLDGLDTIIFSPGDLLTFGGGVNAGKLVKVNSNSIGPDVVIVGVVEKYNSTLGLLYFRYVLDNVSFGTNNLTLFYDFGNPASYTSGTTVYDLSPNSKNGLVQNGPVYTNAGSASYLTFDNSNDVIETNTNATGFGIYNKSFTLVTVCRPSVIAGDKMIFGNSAGVGGQDMLHAGFRGSAIHFGFFGADSTWNYGAVPNQIYYIVWRWNVGGAAYIFVNGTQILSSLTQPAYLGSTNIGLSRSYNLENGSFGGRIYMARIYNRALTDTEVLNLYNSEKTRFGL